MSSYTLWNLISRLGEAQILLPAALLALAWMFRRDGGRRPVLWWLALLATAVLLTTASKVAFLGFGLGSARLNFTGISGHAMFACVVYPLLAGMLGSALSPGGRRNALLAAYALALLVAASRWVIGVHTASEVAAGVLVGGAASAAALMLARLPHTAVGLAVPALLLVWMAAMPLNAPASRTHDWVTSLSLKLSGRAAPYTRSEMLREHRLRQAAPTSALLVAPQRDRA